VVQVPRTASPAACPADWLFAPVWSLLYTMMGLSLALVWHRAPSGPLKTVAVAWFVMQFALNLAWTPVFFGARQVPAGLVVIVGLLLALVMTIVSFFRVERLAAWLLVPYLLWVGYATYLNAGIFVAYK